MGGRDADPGALIAALEAGGRWPAVIAILGEEPLCATETADAVLRLARAQGFERNALEGGAGFDWTRLAAACVSRSLFGGGALVDVDLSTGKPGTAGAKAIAEAIELATQAAGDVVLLLRLPRPDGDLRRAAWFRALEKAARVVHCRPVPRDAMPGWLKRRAAAADVALDDDAARLAAAWLEGNLPAAAQAVARWQLRGLERVTQTDVLEELSDGARFGLFDLEATILAGEPARAASVAERLIESGTPATLLTWLLSRDLHALRAAAYGDRAFLPGTSPATLTAVARRLGARRIELLLAALHEADRRSKGRAAGPDAALLVEIASTMADGRVLRLPRFVSRDPLWQLHLSPGAASGSVSSGGPQDR